MPGKNKKSWMFYQIWPLLFTLIFDINTHTKNKLLYTKYDLYFCTEQTFETKYTNTKIVFSIKHVKTMFIVYTNPKYSVNENIENKKEK
jgi:hypothetical protein